MTTITKNQKKYLENYEKVKFLPFMRGIEKKDIAYLEKVKNQFSNLFSNKSLNEKIYLENATKRFLNQKN